MINNNLIQKLHDNKIIDKKYPFWWQLGFEGRKVLSDPEFREGLREVSYYAKDLRKEDGDSFEVKLKIWANDNVPISIKNIELSGVEIPCFITCCPMSHEGGWSHLNSAIRSQLSPANYGGLVYNQPHIRGVVAETTKDFLFWYPFYFGNKPMYYNNQIIHFDSLDTYLIMDPVHPSKFYLNLIKKEWHKGKRPQKRPIEFEYSQTGLELKQVPYFELNPAQPNITIYPLPVFEDNSVKIIKELLKQNKKWDKPTAINFIDHYPHIFKIKKRLDLPIILRSMGNGKIDILGAGYLTENFAYYWKLDSKQYSLAKKSLKERMNLEV